MTYIPHPDQMRTGLEWAGVAILGLGTVTLAGCLPAVWTLWKLFKRHGRHARQPLYYRVASGQTRLSRVVVKR